MRDHAADLQRAYYARTARAYDEIHLQDGDEHFVALNFLSYFIAREKIESVLDLGSGTGRTILFLRERHPGLRIVGIEPVSELRAVAYAKGVPESDLRGGDATALDFASDSFDVVCEFATLHHIRRSGDAVKEMVRVARRGVFISDSNNFGHGSIIARALKGWLHDLKLWKFIDFVKTRGKGYTYTEGDGIAYSYSVFDSLALVRRKFPRLHFMNGVPASGRSLFHSAPHVALYALDSREAHIPHSRFDGRGTPL